MQRTTLGRERQQCFFRPFNFGLALARPCIQGEAINWPPIAQNGTANASELTPATPEKVTHQRDKGDAARCVNPKPCARRGKVRRIVQGVVIVPAVNHSDISMPAALIQTTCTRYCVAAAAVGAEIDAPEVTPP